MLSLKVVSKQSAAEPERIRSLDGLRAISIVLVLYGHARATVGFPASLKWIDKLGDVADLGVHVFFVISGYLITSLLVAERRKTGTVRLGSFYARRTFRIFPAYYAYLGVIGLLWLAGLVTLAKHDLLYSAFYIVNFKPDVAWVVGHAWSLAVEEQFYLLWPAAFRATAERGGLRVALVAIALGPFIRGGWALLFREHRGMIDVVFPTVADSLAAGCALSLLRPWLSANERYLRWLRSPLLGIGLLAALAISTWLASILPWARWLVLHTVMCVSVALVVDRYVRYPDGPIGRLLNWRPIVYIGTLSYSLYLWQQLFLQYPLRVESVPRWTHFPGNLALSIGAGLLSYYLVEKPMLGLRDRILRRRGPPAAEKPAAEEPAAEKKAA